MGGTDDSHEALGVRIFDESCSGMGLGMGCGSAYSFIKATNKGNSFTGALRSVHMNSYGARCGGRLAVWGALAQVFGTGMYSTFGDEARWNEEIAGVAAGVISQMGRGITGISKGAILGGAVMVLVRKIDERDTRRNSSQGVGLIEAGKEST